MSFKHTFAIKQIMDFYAKQQEKLVKGAKAEYDSISALATQAAQAIQLTVKHDLGMVMPLPMARQWVEQEYITDYDGNGQFLDENGDRLTEMCCSLPALKRAQKNGACFVEWFNK